MLGFLSWFSVPQRRPLLITIALFAATLSGCAAIRPALPPLTPPEVTSIAEDLANQKRAVSSFYSMGTVVMRRWLVESEEAKILVVGTRDPLRIKVEITHPWGPPILHISIDRDRIEAFSYPDAVLYTGPANSETIGRFLPCPPDIDSIWAVLRGYPALPGADTVRPGEGGQVVCFESCAVSPWILQVRHLNLEPERLTFPEGGLEVVFSDIQESGEVRYAGEVEVRPGKGGGRVIIKNAEMVFNREIPEQIFQVKKPPVYSWVELGNETP